MLGEIKCWSPLGDKELKEEQALISQLERFFQNSWKELETIGLIFFELQSIFQPCQPKITDDLFSRLSLPSGRSHYSIPPKTTIQGYIQTRQHLYVAA